MTRAPFAAALALSLAAAGAGHAAEGDDSLFTFFQADANEVRLNGHRGWSWEAQGWVGTDYEKAFLKTEGETEFGAGVESAEAQLLYSRLISDFFDVQAGLRYDWEPEPSQVRAALGLQGLAPYFFEIDATLFLGEDGLSAKFEAEYEIPITQRLWLQPAVEIAASARDGAEAETAAGLSGIEAGVRLRYEFRREFAPYVGAVWERALSGTADIAREHGESIESTAFVAGVRIFF